MSIDILKNIAPVLKFFMFSLLVGLCISCSKEEPVTPEKSTNPIDHTVYTPVSYKGVFATQNSAYRGTFQLVLPKGKENLEKTGAEASATLKLQDGQTFKVYPEKVLEKSSDFKVIFGSSDLTFTFTLDETDKPVISDVVFQGQSAQIIAAQEDENSTVTPVTGTYKCTNCQDQHTSVEGIALNNDERTFNMLLTTADGKTNITIQALLGILVNKSLLVEETCNDYNNYTYCVIKSGNGLTTEPVSWSGVKRFTAGNNGSSPCSTISGAFEYSDATLGSVKGEFKSDSNCPDKTYFVSTTGNDSNTGLSPNDAWETINKVNSIDLQPGDVVLFEGGGEFPGSVYLDSNDGNNSANPVKISSYGTGKAIINSGTEAGFYAYNTSGILINNLIFSGSGMNSNTNSGIYFYTDVPNDTKLDLVEITNCEVFGYKNYGIAFGSWNHNSGFNNVLIENNKVHDILDAGISFYGEFSPTKTGYAHSNITVRNCEVFNIKGYDKNNHSGDGILLSDVQNSTIEHCTVHDCGSGNTNCGGPVGIWYWDSDQVMIEFSEVYNISSGTGCDGGGFDFDGGVTNGIMQYNYSHDNEGGGLMVGEFSGARPMENITVRYNISENDAAKNGGSVFLFNGESSASAMKNIYFYNNTLYSEVAEAIINYSAWNTLNDNINFYNNILYAANATKLVNVPAGYAGNFQGNLYYSPNNFYITYNGQAYSSLESFRESGNESNNGTPTGFQGKPLLQNPGKGGIIGYGNLLSNVTAYKLQAASPAIDQGIPIPVDHGTRDFYGSVLNNGANDIGAQEFSSGKMAGGILAVK